MDNNDDLSNHKAITRVISHPILTLMGKLIAGKVLAGNEVFLNMAIIAQGDGVGVKVEGLGDPLDMAYMIKHFMAAHPAVSEVFNAINKMDFDPGGIGQADEDANNEIDQLKKFLDQQN